MMKSMPIIEMIGILMVRFSVYLLKRIGSCAIMETTFMEQIDPKHSKLK
jgi:hypothetical protein